MKFEKKNKKTHGGVSPAAPLPLAGQDTPRGRVDSWVEPQLMGVGECESMNVSAHEFMSTCIKVT